ncbi:hypothetical protein [Apis mellifera associated microvirus 40]|nr:hypothetical protein [Apis mellifera associated microvirus 40]
MRFSGLPARVVAAPLKKTATARSKGLRRTSMGALLFSAPSRVAVCVQRGVRKEVLHATGNVGRNRPGRPGPFSKVRCK